MNENTKNKKTQGRYFTDVELDLYAQLKRFFECYHGDRDYRKAIDTGVFTDAQIQRLRDTGVKFDLSEVEILWKNKDEIGDCAEKTLNEESFTDEQQKLLDKYPLIKLWMKFNEFKRKRHINNVTNPPNSPNPRYDAWRNRRILSGKSELGSYGHSIDYPALAIEIAKGCSVGCYFCAFDAQKLETVFDYNDEHNRHEFRKVATAFNQHLGYTAGHALMYYSTEPYDNPHYIDFLKEYEKITGSFLCTATAACTKDVWMKELIAEYRKRGLHWPRLSVLSRGMLRKVHELYTAEELRDVALLMQMSESEREKVEGGRIFKDNDSQRDDVEENIPLLGEMVPQGSIACVAGFLVNMIDKTIKLVSPCFTTERWKYGYRIFDERSFENADEFDAILTEMIEVNMPVSLYPEMPMRFRDDLKFKEEENGFSVYSPYYKHDFNSHSIHKKAGALIAQGAFNYDQVFNQLVDEYQFNPFQVMSFLKLLFDNGLLDELHHRPENRQKILIHDVAESI
ncbi:radical SAM family RiPP maturation amino acid epimerase [Catenovulum sediminis]|uniref:Radical SAM family RiPP maturation amino acid epimerase n=1 Tax=Catenovulum sediminis TaxID=1740262 RepID=A0ABV1RI80_9ALTE